MNQDIVIEVAKRTGREVLDQITSTPFVVIPFAVFGLTQSVWWVSLICIIGLVAIVAHGEYKDVLFDIENTEPSVESTSTPVETVVDETEQK